MRLADDHCHSGRDGSEYAFVNRLGFGGLDNGRGRGRHRSRYGSWSRNGRRGGGPGNRRRDGRLFELVLEAPHGPLQAVHGHPQMNQQTGQGEDGDSLK